MSPTAARALPELHGPRLRLRLPEAGDAPGLARFVTENEPHFRPTEPTRPPSFYTEAHWLEQAAKAREAFLADRGAALVLFDQAAPARPVGFVSLSDVVRGAFQACHLGYRIGLADQGKGLMEEALRLVIPYAFGELRLHRLEANHQPANERSGRLLRKLGFVVEGQARDYLFIDGAWRDHVLTSLTNPAWRP